MNFSRYKKTPAAHINTQKELYCKWEEFQFVTYKPMSVCFEEVTNQFLTHAHTHFRNHTHSLTLCNGYQPLPNFPSPTSPSAISHTSFPVMDKSIKQFVFLLRPLHNKPRVYQKELWQKFSSLATIPLASFAFSLSSCSVVFVGVSLFGGSMDQLRLRSCSR